MSNTKTSSRARQSLSHILRAWRRPRVHHKVSVAGVELWIGIAHGRPYKEAHAGIFVFCVSDLRNMLGDYGAGMGARSAIFLEGEMRRLASMNESEWEDFLRLRDCYNPFSDRRNRQRVKAGDKSIRKQYVPEDFKSDRHLSASQKRALLHSYERFITARIFGGKGHALSRFHLPLAHALSSLYTDKKFNSPRDFYTSCFAEEKNLKAHLAAVAHSKDLHGGPWEVKHDTTGDATAALAVVAAAYIKSRSRNIGCQKAQNLV